MNLQRSEVAMISLGWGKCIWKAFPNRFSLS